MNKQFSDLVECYKAPIDASWFLVFTDEQGTPMSNWQLPRIFDNDAEQATRPVVCLTVLQSKEPTFVCKQTQMEARILKHIEDIALEFDIEENYNEHVTASLMESWRTDPLKLQIVINSMSTRIADKTRRGAGNTVIASKQTIDFLKMLPEMYTEMFTFYEADVDDNIFVGYVGKAVIQDNAFAYHLLDGHCHVFTHPTASTYWKKLKL